MPQNCRNSKNALGKITSTNNTTIVSEMQQTLSMFKDETIYFFRIMFSPAIEQYKLSVISYLHVERRLFCRPPKTVRFYTNQVSRSIYSDIYPNYLDK